MVLQLAREASYVNKVSVLVFANNTQLVLKVSGRDGQLYYLTSLLTF